MLLYKPWPQQHLGGRCLLLVTMFRFSLSEESFDRYSKEEDKIWCRGHQVMPLTGLFSLHFFCCSFDLYNTGQPCIFGATHSGLGPHLSIINEEDTQQTYLIAQVLWELGRWEGWKLCRWWKPDLWHFRSKYLFCQGHLLWIIHVAYQNPSYLWMLGRHETSKLSPVVQDQLEQHIWIKQNKVIVCFSFGKTYYYFMSVSDVAPFSYSRIIIPYAYTPFYVSYIS